MMMPMRERESRAFFWPIRRVSAFGESHGRSAESRSLWCLNSTLYSRGGCL